VVETAAVKFKVLPWCAQSTGLVRRGARRPAPPLKREDLLKALWPDTFVDFERQMLDKFLHVFYV
jgi:hypothetical protein